MPRDTDGVQRFKRADCAIIPAVPVVPWTRTAVNLVSVASFSAPH
jgi:hypothetical protein